MWVAVGNQMPCQREQANFEDPFAVAVMKGELIVGCFPPNFLQFASVLLRKGGVNSLSLLLASSIFQPKYFRGGKFHDLAFDRENHENYALWKCPAIQYLGTVSISVNHNPLNLNQLPVKGRSHQKLKGAVTSMLLGRVCHAPPSLPFLL